MTDLWEYAPAPENRDIANLKPSYRMFLDGEFVEGEGEPLKSVNPATEEVLAEVSTAAPSDVDKAVKAARRAYDRVWGRMWKGRGGPPAAPTTGSGAGCRAPSGPSTSSGSRG